MFIIWNVFSKHYTSSHYVILHYVHHKVTKIVQQSIQF